tara:strand:- start:7467 stop:7781 length:315 start_codon:yes stop_codon:yes gene_type:complete
MLFDVSNAIIAEHNGGDTFESYRELIESNSLPMHIAGYSISTSNDLILIDTHSESLSEKSKEFYQCIQCKNISSIVLERDFNFNSQQVAADLEFLNSARTPHAL